jgi:hypothetical protein
MSTYPDSVDSSNPHEYYEIMSAEGEPSQETPTSPSSLSENSTGDVSEASENGQTARVAASQSSEEIDVDTTSEQVFSVQDTNQALSNPWADPGQSTLRNLVGSTTHLTR